MTSLHLKYTQASFITDIIITLRCIFLISRTDDLYTYQTTQNESGHWHLDCGSFLQHYNPTDPDSSTVLQGTLQDTGNKNRLFYLAVLS